MDARQIKRGNQPLRSKRAEQHVGDSMTDGILPRATGLQVGKQDECGRPERPAQLLQATGPIQSGNVAIAKHNRNDNGGGQLKNMGP